MKLEEIIEMSFTAGVSFAKHDVNSFDNINKEIIFRSDAIEYTIKKIKSEIGKENKLE